MKLSDNALTVVYQCSLNVLLENDGIETQRGYVQNQAVLAWTPISLITEN